MSGSYYTLNSKYNQLKSILAGLPISGSGLTGDLNANNYDILNVDNITLTTINGLPPAGAENLQQTLTIGNDAGGLDITNLNQLSLSGTSTITDSTGDLVIQPPTNQTIQLGNNIYVDTQNNRIGINVPAPTEDLEIDGNIQMDTGSTSKIVFYDKPNDHEHGEIDAEGEGTDGGLIRFQTKEDGGVVGERLRIDNIGRIGLSGANYGTSGQVLTSNGATAPTWETPAAGGNKVINDQTASYTLVAADNNKRVIMDSASATDITINNSVFVAGDSVFIANKGTGTTTIVEGAGVSIGTSAGLELVQYRSALLLAFSPTNFSLFLSAFNFVAISATGGDSTNDVSIAGTLYRVHTFTSVGTSALVVSSIGSNPNVEYLVVAGGGNAPDNRSGGGGGGGVLTNLGGSGYTITTGSLSVVVGAGGGGGPSFATGDNGDNSTFDAITATGGGHSGWFNPPNQDGDSGGSGGGGGGPSSAPYGIGGSGIAGQGNNGGNGDFVAGGGGGGAGAVGQTAPSGDNGGDGGNGIQVDIDGNNNYYGGGGGGAGAASAGTGGLGGGGDGNTAGSSGGTAGTPNTGGGAGGGRYAGNSTAGGSGIVIIRYRLE